jgi:hypothetical protein
MPKFAGTSGKSAPKVEGTGGNSGSFVRQTNLVGELVIATPVEVIHGLYNEGKPDERPTRKLSADVVVLTGPHAGNHPAMHLSGGKIVDKGVEILDAKSDTVLAGRMTRVPLKKYREAWPTAEALEIAIADPKVVVPGNAYVWLIPDASAADMAKVMAYYQGGQETPSADEDPERDPFEE